jgi:hypothetical protein
MLYTLRESSQRVLRYCIFLSRHRVSTLIILLYINHKTSRNVSKTTLLSGSARITHPFFARLLPPQHKTSNSLKHLPHNFQLQLLLLTPQSNHPTTPPPPPQTHSIFANTNPGPSPSYDQFSAGYYPNTRAQNHFPPSHPPLSPTTT